MVCAKYESTAVTQIDRNLMTLLFMQFANPTDHDILHALSRA